MYQLSFVCWCRRDYKAVYWAGDRNLVGIMLEFMEAVVELVVVMAGGVEVIV